MKYQLLYADCPWDFITYSDKGKEKSPSQHYPTLDLEEIKKLNVASIAEKDSVIAFWIYNPMLPECIEVMEAWGFKFTTILFNWTKTTKDGSGPAFGQGYYTRHNTELCLLGKRGKGLKVFDRGIRQQVSAPKEEHSKKPEIIRTHLENLFGDVSRVELFARKNASNMDNWTLVGNEVNGMDIRDALEAIKNGTYDQNSDMRRV